MQIYGISSVSRGIIMNGKLDVEHINEETHIDVLKIVHSRIWDSNCTCVIVQSPIWWFPSPFHYSTMESKSCATTLCIEIILIRDG